MESKIINRAWYFLKKIVKALEMDVDSFTRSPDWPFLWHKI